MHQQTFPMKLGVSFEMQSEWSDVEPDDEHVVVLGTKTLRDESGIDMRELVK